jgi:hypothetical protein
VPEKIGRKVQMLKCLPDDSYSIIRAISKLIPGYLLLAAVLKIASNLLKRAVREVEVPKSLSESDLMKYILSGVAKSVKNRGPSECSSCRDESKPSIKLAPKDN